MGTVIFLVAVFLAVGIALIIWRAPAARGFSLAMGATTPPYFMVVLALCFFGLAALVVFFHMEGLIGHR